MTILQTNEETPAYTPSPTVTSRDAADSPIVQRIHHTYDLPFGGSWMVVDLDHSDQWRALPAWMTKHGVWLMQSSVIEQWYAWMPVKDGEG